MTNIRRALWLGLLLVCLTAVSWAQLPVADDSYITSTNPTTNSGNSPSLVLQQATNGITLIKIDISPLQAAGVTSSAIDKAYLKLYTSAVTGQGTFDLYQITSSWAEGTVTYNTKPTMTLITSGTTCPSGVQCVNTASKYVQIDITSLVQGWLANPPVSNFGLALKPNSTTISVTFESKESTTTSHAPELDIVYNNSLAQIPGQIGPGQVGPGTYSINISGTAANATLAAGLSGQIQLCQNGQVAIGITSVGNAVCLVGPLSIANGGTGATTGAAALASLGGVSQTYVDAHDTAEATARAAADATLQSNINAETARAQSAEGTLTTNLNGEISRAQNAEATKADLIKPVQVNNSAAGNGACSLVNALVLNPTQPSGQQLFVCRDIGGGTLQWQLINDDFATTSSANSYTDQQVAIEKSRATTAEAGLQSSINAETSRAQGAETTLQTNINGEAAARAAQDIALGASIASETTRATGAESTLQTNINNVNAASAKLNGTNQFTGGSQKLAPSAAGYASLNVASSNTPPSSPAIGDLWLLSNDPHLNFRATNAASELLAFISDINTANGTTLAAASQYTDAQVAAEKARAMAAESALTTNLNNEITRATSAETAETSARQAADSAEAGARIAADSALSASILAETSRATSSENILTTGLNNEISRAQAAEATKADLVTPVKLDNTAVLHNTCATVNALVLNNNQPSGQQLFICRSVNNVLQWELINDDASTVQTATAAANAYTDQQVAAEASARQAADNTLQSNINAEASARQTADSAEATARAAADAAEIVARQAGDAATLAAANTYTDSAKTNILTQPQTFSGNETFSGNNSFSGTNSFTGKVDMTGAPTFPVQTTSTTPPSSGQPNACASGQLLLQVNGQPGQQLFVCNAAHDGWAMINDDAASINSAVTTANAYTDSKVLAEQNRATTTETGLQSSINAESSRAQGAEATLQGNINAEAGARMAQDVILGTAIATEATRATAAESTLTTNLNNEISRAQAAEATKADLIAPVQLDNTAVLHNTCGTVNALVLNNTQPSGQ